MNTVAILRVSLSAESGELLGRTDPYVPMNIDIGGTVKNLDQNIARLERNPTQLLAHAPPKRNAGLRVAP